MNYEFTTFSRANKPCEARAVSQPKNDVFGLSEDAAEILRIVRDALREFPEARAAVVSALNRSERPT